MVKKLVVFRKRLKAWYKIFVIPMVSICFFAVPVFVRGEEISSPRDSQVVFLLDGSNSMNSHGGSLAVDGLRQMLYSLPFHTQVGFAVYNTEIQCQIEVGAPFDQLEEAFHKVEYTGYTNAGLGLERAVSMLSKREGKEKRIIMISDGEIALRGKEETAESKEQCIKAYESAREKGIEIHIIAIGEEADKEMEILEAARATGGKAYKEGAQGTLSQMIENLVKEELKVPRRSVGTASLERESGRGEWDIDIPVKGALRARILLIGSQGVSNVQASYMAEKGQVITGERFAAVDLEKPQGDRVHLVFDKRENTGVDAYLMLEYEGALSVETSFEKVQKEEKEQGKSMEATPILHLSMRLMNQHGERKNLWETEGYQGHPVFYEVNGQPFEGKVEEGILLHSMEGDEIQKVAVSLDMDSFPEMFYIEQPVEVDVEWPKEEPKQNYVPLWGIMGGLGGALLCIFFLWKKRDRATLIYVEKGNHGQNLEKYETKSCQYTGKLNIYVVQSKSGKDYPPSTFFLFGRKSTRMTFAWILEQCKIKLGSSGPEDIVFYPGADKAVIVMDQSKQCTVMRGMEILKKGIGYPVFYHEKLTITLEDGMTELEIHYKNLKPRERDM